MSDLIVQTIEEGVLPEEARCCEEFLKDKFDRALFWGDGYRLSCPICYSLWEFFVSRVVPRRKIGVFISDRGRHVFQKVAG